MTDPDTTRVPTQPPADPVTPPAADPVTPPPDPVTPPASRAAAPPNRAAPPPNQSWRPPASDSGRNASLIFGAIILVIGLWFFATRTLGLDLPDFDWGTFWPVILIALGAWIVFAALRQRSR